MLFGGVPYQERLTELALLRKKAERVCAEMRATLEVWHEAKALWDQLTALTRTLREDSREIRKQARLGVEHSRHRRMMLPAGYLSPAAGYYVLAHNDNVGGEGDAFVRCNTEFD